MKRIIPVLFFSIGALIGCRQNEPAPSCASSSICNQSVYPNPFVGQVTLDLKSNATAQGHIAIFNLQGQQEYTENIDINSGSNSFQIDLEDLKSGVYIFSISSQQDTLVSKIVKKDP